MGLYRGASGHSNKNIFLGAWLGRRGWWLHATGVLWTQQSFSCTRSPGGTKMGKILHQTDPSASTIYSLLKPKHLSFIQSLGMLHTIRRQDGAGQTWDRLQRGVTLSLRRTGKGSLFSQPPTGSGQETSLSRESLKIQGQKHTALWANNGLPQCTFNKNEQVNIGSRLD